MSPDAAGPTGSTRSEDPRRTLGAFGEDLVAGWYRRSGFVIVDRNWRVGRGEIDLVTAKGRLLVFCEVKTRSTGGYGMAVEAVTPAKQARLRSLALAWLAAHPDVHPQAMRFDVAAITGTDVAVVVGAF